MKLKLGKKSGLKYFGINDIRAWRPCYDPKKFLAEDWRGTAIDILNDVRIPHEDRLWVVLRPEITSDRVLRLFAVWCARQVQHLMTDERSIRALDVAERFANGNASEAELAAAWDAAGAVAWVAAWDAAGAAAWDAAGAAARDAAWDAQRSKLIEMIEAEGRERKAVRRVMPQKQADNLNKT